MKNYFDFSLFYRVLRLSRPYRRHFVLATLFAILVALVTPALPAVIQFTVDDYIANADYSGLVFMVTLLIAITLIQAVLRYFFIYATAWLGQQIIKDLRMQVYDHLIGLRLKYFDNTPVGTSVTRTINDIEAINDVFANGIIDIIADLLTMIAVIGVMFYFDWQLSLVCLTTLPLILIATYIFKEAVKVSFQEVRNQVARMNAFLQEHITGMKIVQIFTVEQREMERFKGINNLHKKANIRAIWAYSIFFPVIEIISAIALALIVWYGALQVVGGFVGLGTLITFYLLINLLFRPMRMLADKFNTLQMGLVAADRVFKILDTDEVIENNGQLDKGVLKGSIAFHNVWFAYNDEDWVLKDVSFELKPGETMAIVGATGSGKTSTINLINRFYDIQKGEILIDGRDIRDYNLDALRGNIGNVLQDVFLFSGTIFENITLRNRSMTREEVVHAAKVCGIHDFIMHLPGNYDFDVKERGGTLSLGQRQLIAFIRTLVYNPAILILDEATSSIDTESEVLIQNAIEKLVTNRTSIIIAHRLSTIQHADKILVLDKGKVVEAGTHDELLEHNGHYRTLYELQFKRQKVA